jgi:SpoVK/Ycf46/Vps4 family AAA+-type ATPase
VARRNGVACVFKRRSSIARELDRYLLRIDPSRVVSKYIGETEKNIDAVFAEAKRSGAVLLVDEADALFGERSEVKNSHDRYSNLEVSYLLRRIEACAGVAILATNLRQNIYEAFVRGLRNTSRSFRRAR